MIRVTIVQPSLAKYRVAVYQQLAARSGIALQLMYGKVAGIPNVEPEGFSAALRTYRTLQLGQHVFMWHQAQMDACSPAVSDVAILSWDMHYASLMPALARAQRKGVGTVLWGHGYSKAESPLRTRIRGLPTRLADSLLFYSSDRADAYAPKYGFPLERLFVAPNSVDHAPIKAALTAWLENPTTLQRFRAEHGLEHRRIVLFCSRLESENRVDLLLQAVHHIRQQCPDILAIVIGRGPASVDLETIRDRLDLNAHVRFLGAMYEEAKLAPWFLSAHLYCYPAQIGLSLMHAFGYGLPVLAGYDEVSRNPELAALEHGHNGLLVPQGDVSALSSSLLKVITDEQLLKQLGSNAYRTATEGYSMTSMVDGFEAAIQCAYEQGRQRR